MKFEFKCKVIKTGKIGTPIRKTDFDPRAHPNAREKPRHLAGRTHYLLEFSDGLTEWYSKYELKKLEDTSETN